MRISNKLKYIRIFFIFPFFVFYGCGTTAPQKDISKQDMPKVATLLKYMEQAVDPLGVQLNSTVVLQTGCYICQCKNLRQKSC